jgi:predicted transcriptional regulator
MTHLSVGVKNRILDTIGKKPMSLSEVSRVLNVRRDFVSGYLEAMRHEGKVNVVAVGRSKVYSPKERS